MATENTKGDSLWEIARGRVVFRRSCQSYVVINLFLIAIWYFSGRGDFWPKWVLLGWGIAILMQYLHYYHSKSIDEEYKKLKKTEKK